MVVVSGGLQLGEPIRDKLRAAAQYIVGCIPCVFQTTFSRIKRSPTVWINGT